MTNSRLAAELDSGQIDSAIIVRVDLDSGPWHATDAQAFMSGGLEIRQAVLSFGQLNADRAELTISASAAPDGWFANRRIRLWRVVRGDAPEAGELLFDGVVEGQPGQQDGVLSLSASKAVYSRPKMVPSFGVITNSEFPQADDSAQGKDKPLIFGAVEECQLLPVQVGKYTTLRATAYPGDDLLQLDDCGDWPASGDVVVDGQTYSYSARSDNELYGVAVARQHNEGTLAHEDTDWVYLAAGHAVQSIDTITAGETALTGAAIDLDEATVTFQSPPHREKIGGVSTLYAQFDQVNPASTAIDGVNCIQAATGSAEIQSSTNAPFTFVGGASGGTITFSRPTVQGGSNAIIGAAYEVSFSVVATNDCQVTIGGKLAYVRSGGAVIFNQSPLEWLSQQNTDAVAISVAVADGVSPSVATVTIHAASRTVVVGNSDSANYAILRPVSNKLISVKQTDSMPQRGRISRAQLAIEWAVTDALQSGESIQVRWNGAALGTLTQTTSGAQTESLGFSFDLSASGKARLFNSDLSTVISGGTAALSNTTSIIPQTVTSNYTDSNVAGYRQARMSIKPPQKVIGGIHYAKVRATNTGSNSTTIYIYDNVDSSNWGSPSRSIVISPGGTTNTGFSVTANQTDSVGISHEGFVSSDITFVATVEVDWNVTPETLSSTAASGSTSVLNNNLPLNGTLANSQTLTIDAPPRTVISYFDLTEREWSDFTNKTAELELVSSRTGLSVLVPRVLLAIEYLPVTREPAAPEDLRATVTGLSGNPADVIEYLATAAGDSVSAPHFRRAKAWYEDNNWFVSRAITAQVEARQVMYGLCDELGVIRADGRGGLEIYRDADATSGVITPLSARDFMVFPSITWSSVDSRYNDLTIKYRRINSSATRAITLSDEDSEYSRVGKKQVSETLYQTTESEWVANDFVASFVAKSLLQSNAILRRSFTASLAPKHMILRRGDLVSYDGSIWRIQSSSLSGTINSVSAEELPRIKADG
jgi:hypothetical protein